MIILFNMNNMCIANDLNDLCRQQGNAFHCAMIDSRTKLNNILKILCTD